MTYWHMQIKYYDIIEDNKKFYLKLNNLESNKDLFEIIKNKVKNNDFILIKDRNRPIELVQVINVLQDNVIEIRKINLNIKILEDYPLGSVDTELKEITNPNLPAYKYIKDLVEGNVKQHIKDIKLKEIYIENYKMFNKFKINFTNNKNESLPIVVIAGANGIGKTSLMEVIFYYRYILNESSYLEIQYKGDETIINRNLIKEYEYIEKQNEERVNKQFKEGSEIAISFVPDKYDSLLFLEKSIIYIKAMDNNIDDVKEYILSYYRKESRRLDSYNKAREKIKNYIKEIFTSIDLTFELLDIDDTEKDNEKVTFRNKNGKEFSIDSLSTGEKTLMSKVLYLYFKDIKNKIIFIDEPELSLHPAWQNRVLKLYENFAKENNCQIIIATHSPHIIGSAKSEYLRILVEENGKIEVIDNFSGIYGAKLHQVLTDVMGVEDLRTPEVSEKFKIIEKMIANNQFDTQEFENKWQELEQELGKNYFDLKLLKLEIASRRKNV